MSHGNADVERGFSKSQRVLTDEKAAMKERTLNARLTVFDSTQKFKNKLHLFPVTQDLIAKTHLAHKSYRDHLESEKYKQEKEAEAKKKEKERLKKEKENFKILEKENKKVKELELKLKSMQRERNLKQNSSNALVAKANKELEEALHRNDFTSAHVAREMLIAAEKLRREQEQKDLDILNLSKTIESKRRKVVDDLMRKKRSKHGEEDNSNGINSTDNESTFGRNELSRKKKLKSVKDDLPKKRKTDEKLDNNDNSKETLNIERSEIAKPITAKTRKEKTSKDDVPKKSKTDDLNQCEKLEVDKNNSQENLDFEEPEIAKGTSATTRDDECSNDDASKNRKIDDSKGKKIEDKKSDKPARKKLTKKRDDSNHLSVKCKISKNQTTVDSFLTFKMKDGRQDALDSEFVSRFFKNDHSIYTHYSEERLNYKEIIMEELL